VSTDNFLESKILILLM